MSSTFNHAPQVDAFYFELLAGKISGVQPRPALTMDVHELYRTWCNRRSVPSLAPAYLVKLLTSRHRVFSVRKRYAVGNEIRGPHGVLYLVMLPAPSRGFEADWLGEHVASFRAAVNSYAGYGKVMPLFPPSAMPIGSRGADA